MSFTDLVIQIIHAIPEGKVKSYGSIARAAGNPRGARQVARILHTQSRKHKLPWHRVVNRKGEISISDPVGRDVQKSLLESEGVVVENYRVDLEKFGT